MWQARIRRRIGYRVVNVRLTIPVAMTGLRGRLVASHIAVILLCLALSGGIFVFLLRDYQEQLAKNRLVDLAYPVVFQVRAFERSNVPITNIVSFLQEQAKQLHTRIFLLDRNDVVVADSDGKLVGKTVPMKVAGRVTGRRPSTAGTIEGPTAATYFFVAVPIPVEPLLFASESRPSAFATLIVATPRYGIATTWRELLPSLLLAGAGSLALSLLVSVWLSRSIARPLARMTRASEEMARGQLNQAIPVQGYDEAGRLAVAFNAMAAQVHASQRLLRDFVANVSHELRTPLTSVHGFASAIADGAVTTPEDIVQSARIIVEESNRMHHLVDDLMYLSKLESGQLPLERTSTVLADLIDVALQRVAQRAVQSGVTITRDYTTSLRILADGRRMEQVLGNLLDNALNHTPPGGVLSVTAGRTDTPGADTARTNGMHERSPRRVFCAIHNTGSFIPPEERERVFERFYQTDRSRQHTGGAGLGLSICYEIVAAHGVRMSVESDEHTGTTFIVELPEADGLPLDSDSDEGAQQLRQGTPGVLVPLA